MILGRSTPDPRLGSSVKLSCRDASGLLNFVGEGFALSRKPHRRGKGATSPPGRVEPARTSGNEDLMEPGMLCQPSAGLGGVVAGEGVGDEEEVGRRLVGLDVREEG